MPARTTIKLPKSLHERLRERSRSNGASITSLIVGAVEQTYSEPTKGIPFPRTHDEGRGKRRPLYLVDENPHDLMFF